MLISIRPWAVTAIVFVGTLLCAPAWGQNPGPGIVIMPSSIPTVSGARNNRRGDRDGRSPVQQQLYKEERLKQIVSDSNKLLSLTKELKAEIEKMSGDTLSPEMTKKLEEIEKLAQRVIKRENE